MAYAYKAKEKDKGQRNFKNAGSKGPGFKRDGRTPGKKFTPYKNTARFQIPKDFNFDYKNFNSLQKFLTERGKIIPRRVSEVSAKNQRKLVVAIKRARFLALLSTGGLNK